MPTNPIERLTSTAQAALLCRGKLNSAASRGAYTGIMEQALQAA